MKPNDRMLRAAGALQKEIRKRQDADAALQRGLERTAELAAVNGHLQREIVERERLEQALRESQQAEQRLWRALNEKEVLLKEIHHRVKNNLQIISSLLNLQARYTTDPAVLSMLKSSCGRIRSMALIHEKLYQSTDLAHIDMAEYLQHLAAQLQRIYAVCDTIVCHVRVEHVFLEADAAISCALIVNELVANALKHAFPEGRSGRIFIELRAFDDGRYTLVVSDDGRGLADNVDVTTTTSLGLRLVNDLTEQLNGTLQIDRGHGTRFMITIPGPLAGLIRTHRAPRSRSNTPQRYSSALAAS